MRFSTPDTTHPVGPIHHKPSWAGEKLYINEEHEQIFEQTKDLPGWQHVNDSMKLYELGYQSGSVILEIGVFGGRSCVVELKGALAAMRDAGGPPPQFYGLDISAAAFKRSWPVIEAAGVAEHVILYHGNTIQFFNDIPITPTMVFVDGDHKYPGVWSDMQALAGAVAPGTPILCHDYTNPTTEVKKAIDEWIERGFYEPYGTFGCSMLLVATDRCAGVEPRRLPDELFLATRKAIGERYEAMLESPIHVPVADITEPARIELKSPSVTARA